jgi:Tfp pilus tip-associated adhesin PilY1
MSHKAEKVLSYIIFKRNEVDLMKISISFLLLFLSIAFPLPIYTGTMSDYCSAPPYVTRTAPANIMLVYEKGNDILKRAWKNKEYNHLENYYGFFESGSRYSYTTSPVVVAGDTITGGYFEENPSCDASAGSNCFSGRLLNWALMSSLDISRKALIGFGWAEPGSAKGAGDVFSYSEELISTGQWEDGESGAGCVTGGGYSFRLSRYSGSNKITSIAVRSGSDCASGPLIIDNGQVALKLPRPAGASDTAAIRKRIGLVQRYADTDRNREVDPDAPRIGIRRWNSGAGNSKQADIINNAPTSHDLQSNFGLLLTAISSAPPGDPVAPDLALMMKDIWSYFQSSSSSFNDGSTVAFTQTPYDWDSDPLKACRQTYAVFITTGVETGVASGAMTDGCTEGPASTPFSQNTCYAYRSDLFPGDGSPPRQNIISYVVHTSFYGNGAGNGPKLRYAATATTGKYVQADSPAEIETLLEQVFLDILRRTASGTTVSFISSSSRHAGSAVQAYFLPSRLEEGPRDIRWTGYLQNIWVDQDDNLREDSVQDRRLLLSQDKVMRLYFNSRTNETEAALFTTDAEGRGGTLASCSRPEIIPFMSLKGLWEAGRKLSLQKPSSRRLFSATTVRRGSEELYKFPLASCGFRRDVNCFTVPHVSGNETMTTALNADAVYGSGDIIRYVRGECLETGVSGDAPCLPAENSSFRDRRLIVDGTTRVWKLGDIINSSPKVFSGSPLNAYHIDYADKSYYDYISDSRYRNKSSVAFVGANDGMLHAFHAGYLKDKDLSGEVKALLKDFFHSSDSTGGDPGEELWAYIPFNAFPYLKYLAEPSYCHMYYSDLSVRLIDASIQGLPATKRSRDSWKTLLIGGMRLGGACGPGGMPAEPPDGIETAGFSAYFAIDVTDPENPAPLWEFSDPDLGYTTSYPAVARMGAKDENGNWFLVLGSGTKVLPKTKTDIGRTSPGYLYILDLASGELVKKIQLDHNAIVGDILVIDADKDYVSEKIYFGTAFRTGSTWAGKLTSVSLPEAAGSAGVNVTWTSSLGKTLFGGEYPFTASPDAVKDTRGNIWVYAGSGKYYSDIDEIDESPQIFLGLKDTGGTIAENSLFSAGTRVTSGDVSGTDSLCAYDSLSNSFTKHEIVSSIKTSSSSPSDADSGWKIYLSGRERVISRPLAAGGVIDFLTYRPNSDLCRYGGETFLYAVGYTTGVAPPNVAIRSPGSTSAISGTVTVNNRILLGPGAPSAGEAIALPPPREGVEALRKKIQVATGGIVETENMPVFSIASRIMHWLKK